MDLICTDCDHPADRERPLGVTQGGDLIVGDLIVDLVCRDHEVD